MGRAERGASTGPESAIRGRGSVPLPGLLGVFALSGAAALVYQVLWLKELGRLFGVTAYATSTTLAARRPRPGRPVPSPASSWR